MKKIETVLDIEARLPAAVRRSIATFEIACQAIGGVVGGGSDEARCYREGRYDNARVNLASDIDEAIGAQIRALDTREAALDEARGRIEALERENAILREARDAERADVLAFLEGAATSSDAMFTLAGGQTQRERDAMRSTLRSARKTIAQGAHVGLVAQATKAVA